MINAFTITALGILLLSGRSMAQAPSSCPINYVKVEPVAAVFGTSDPWGWELRIKYKNTSQQNIVAIKFGAAFIDATKDEHESPTNYTASLHLKAGAVTSSHWGDGVFVHEMGMFLGVKVWLLKVVFEDGTSWQPEHLGEQCWMSVSPRTRKF